jgi:hypothetical protein
MEANSNQSRRDFHLFAKGILSSNAFALVAFCIAFAVTNWSEDAGSILVFSEFVLVPMGMGIIAMKFWMGMERRFLAQLPYALVNTAIALLLAAIFLGEGIICLLIVSPLIVGFMVAGMSLGRVMYKDDNKRMKASTVLLLVAIFVFDTFSTHDYSNAASDEITINAPREAVWKYVAAHPVNDGQSDYWLFDIGLPCPVQSTVSGTTVGSERKCIFSNGAVFDEVIVESEAKRVFTFDIVRQPNDPEIIGHIQIQRGQFVLTENPDGSTTLTGTSWYKLNVYPVWYYDLWAEDITRKVHIRVMKHIKALAENDI